jgi:tetratricopeptide (TPR) repeat protein
MKPFRILPCLAFLLFSAGVAADQNDPRLEDLFNKLQAADDPVEAAPIEELIWQIWFEHSDPGIESQIMTAVAQMNGNQLDAALATLNRLVEAAPDFAEAWNRRATLHYIMGNYAASEADIVKTLQLEPFHFGALSGRGLVLISQGKYEEARNAFSRALEVNPNMPEVKNNIDQINQYLRNRTI